MSEFTKTLNILEKVVGYWTSPLEWNRRQGKVLHWFSSTKLLPWLIVLLFCGFQVLTCSLLLGLQFFGLVQLPMVNILFFLGVWALQGIAFLVEMAKLLCGRIAAQVFGEFLVIDKRSKEGNLIYDIVYPLVTNVACQLSDNSIDMP